MIVCTDCGHRNEDGDDFCGSCGAFLEFSGERTETTAPEPAAAPAPEDEGRATIVERVKAAVGLGDQPEGDVGGGPGDVAGGDGEGGSGPSPAEVDEAAAAAAAEALELRRRSDEEAQRRADEARRLAEEATAAAEAARQAAEAEARRADEAEARQAAERAAREEAERAVAEAQEQVRLAAEAAERAAQERAEAEAAERDRAVSAEAVEAEREAAAEAARASAEAELARRAEAERVAREAAEEEARQRAEAEAREQAERAAREEAEAARRQAEEQAAAAKAALEEAEARARDAEQAARMAALVAKAKPATPPPPAPVTPTATPAAPASPAPEVAGLVADATGPGAGRKPEAVKPQRQRVKRPAAAATQDEVLNPGDLVCGSCGTGNDPQRRFCRRCGSSLVEAAVVARPPWYRRIFRRKPKAKAEAGTRRDQAGGSGQGLTTRGKYAFLRARSTSRKVGRIVALLALVGVTGLSLGPWKGAVGDQIAKVKRIISPEYEPVRPASASATSELDGHPAAAATDQVSNSYWAEGAEGTGEGQGLTFTFGEPVDLDRIGLLNGASEDPKDFVTQPRVRELQLLFDDGTTTSLTIKDEAEFQQHGIEARDVTTVQLQIISVYPSLDGSAASLAEVEFFRKE